MIKTNYEILLLIERNREIENNSLYLIKLIKKLMKENFNFDSFIDIKKITNCIRIKINIRHIDNLEFLIKFYFVLIQSINKMNLMIYQKRLTQFIVKQEVIKID